MGTKSRIVIYQHLFVHFCTKTLIFHLVQLVQMYQKASNTNDLRGIELEQAIAIYQSKSLPIKEAEACNRLAVVYYTIGNFDQAVITLGAVYSF